MVARLLERLQASCLERGLTVATAESCTGGLVAKLITDLAGSSGYFRGGIVTYADEAKVRLLGVPAEQLAAHGAVSAQVALSMALGARDRTGADIAVAITGVSGPGGGSPSKPIGLTYIAVADPAGTDVRRFVWAGDRAANREASARAAVELLLERALAGGATPPVAETAETRRQRLSHVRGAASVGSGLAPAREARAIRDGERIHVVGAAGAGASAAALLAHESGALVSGCDPGGPSPYTPALEAAGLHLDWEHSAAHVTGGAPDRLAVTKALTAVDPDNPELVAARAASVPLEPWQQVVADAAVGRTLVGVAGTHGKSTTSGWLVHVLVEAGLDPCAFVGALLPAALTGGLPSTARWGEGRPFVVEADEYAGNFDPYRPDLAVLTSAEWDHPDVFADRAAVVDCFVAWLGSASRSVARPILVANVADEGVAQVVERLGDWPGDVLSIRLLEGAPGRAFHPEAFLLGTIVAADAAGTTLTLEGSALAEPLSTRLRLAGRHNAANALSVAAAALTLGVAPAAVGVALGSFGGVGRRLERKGEGRGVVVYDDYGHHPTAIRETLAAIRQLEPGRRVWAVYEPLTYHRTAAMLDAFAEVLATADAVAVAEIWAGRDPDTTITSAGALAEATARVRPGLTAVAPGTVEETAAWLASHVREGDAVLVMGGGRSYRIAELLMQALAG